MLVDYETDLVELTRKELAEKLTIQNALSRLVMLGCREYETKFRKVSSRIVALRQWLDSHSDEGVNR